MTFQQARRQSGAILARVLPALCVLALIVCLPAFGQDAPAVKSAATAAQDKYALTATNLIVASGVVGWIICVLSVVTLAVVIENVVTLTREKLAPPELIDEIQSLFDEGQFQEAMELCENERNYFTRICAAGISKIGHDFEVIEQSIGEMGDEETIKLHQKIGWIGVLAAVSPMLGLFGTVQGMIASFHTIATTTNPTPAELAGGIYVALLTTLFGLMIAIPATAAFAWIRNRLVRTTIEVGAIVEDLFERFRNTKPA